MTLRTKEHLTTHLGLSAHQVLIASQGSGKEFWVIPRFPEAGASAIFVFLRGDL